MYQLYKRVRRDKENKGSRLIEGEENPFLEGPTLLCIAAVPAEKSVFGMSKMGMMMAGLRVKGNEGARFDVQDFPVSFLSLKSSGPDSEFESFAEKYFTPLIANNGEKLDVETAMKNVRNINVMSYCDGTCTAKKIESFMIKKMNELGYSEEEIKKIQSQMFVLSIATNRLNGPQKSNWIYFLDANDGEVNDNVTEADREKLSKSALGETLIIGDTSKTVPVYLINGDGEHDLKAYQRNGRAMPVCLCSIVSRALKSSIASSKGNFNALTIDELIVDIPEITKQAIAGKTLWELMQDYYDGLEYGVERLTNREIKMLDELDISYDELEKTVQKNKSLERTLSSTKTTLDKVKAAAKKYCSDINFKKINMASGYQYSKAQADEINNTPSDREIIEGLQRDEQTSPVNLEEAEKVRLREEIKAKMGVLGDKEEELRTLEEEELKLDGKNEIHADPRD